MKKSIVVVGGVAGGMSFATRYRRLNQEDKIIILDKGPYVSFANCGLPYYLSGEIKKRDNLLVAKENNLVKQFNFDIRTNHEVIDINENSKKIVVRSNKEIYELSYDKLILSPGAKPFIPKIKNIDLIKYFTLRNIPDLDKIVSFIENYKPLKASIIGAGFIGIEVAEALKIKGLEVSIIEASPHILPPLDEEMAAFARSELISNGVEVYENKTVTEVENDFIILNDGTKIQTELLIISAGVMPSVDFIKNTSIKMGVKNAIVVDKNYETSIKDIYAVGDAIITKNIINDSEQIVALASPANRQGRQLADILNGINNYNKGNISTSILRVFNKTLAMTGLNERQLNHTNYKTMHLLGKDHAGYFPGATPINLKVLFNPETLAILGAQAFGEKGVDKRIDVLATAIKAGMKVTDLQELELTYAPPFGSAKDIINMAGYYAQNIILGLTNTVSYKQVDNMVENGATLIDVRTREERKMGYIKNSIHIEINEIEEKINLIDKNKPVILYCESGIRSYNAERILKNLGYEAYNLDGSFSIYKCIYQNKVVK